MGSRRALRASRRSSAAMRARHRSPAVRTAPDRRVLARASLAPVPRAPATAWGVPVGTNASRAPSAAHAWRMEPAMRGWSVPPAFVSISAAEGRPHRVAPAEPPAGGGARVGPPAPTSKAGPAGSLAPVALLTVLAVRVAALAVRAVKSTLALPPCRATSSRARVTRAWRRTVRSGCCGPPTTGRSTRSVRARRRRDRALARGKPWTSEPSRAATLTPPCTTRSAPANPAPSRPCTTSPARTTTWSHPLPAGPKPRPATRQTPGTFPCGSTAMRSTACCFDRGWDIALAATAAPSPRGTGPRWATSPKPCTWSPVSTT